MLWGTLGTLLRFKMENGVDKIMETEMQILYVSESVTIKASLGKYQLVIRDRFDQDAIDRALKKCNLTLDEVEVIDNS